MRINARLDDSYEEKFIHVQQDEGKNRTDILKAALDQYFAKKLAGQAKPGDKMKQLLRSDFVASFDGVEDLSSNYKEYVAEHLDEKYPQHTK